MPNVVASLAILATLGAALALAGPDGERAEPAGDDWLPANVAVRVSAPAPARTLPGAALRPGPSSLHPALARGMRRVWRAAERRGVNPRRDLLAPLSDLAISLERSCPPPAILSCRPAIRLTGRLRDLPRGDLRRDVRIALVAGLRAAGFRGLTVHRPQAADFAGRLGARGETLARWRLADGLLEVATGGLGLDGPAPDPRTTAGDERTAGGMPGLTIETNPATLAVLLR